MGWWLRLLVRAAGVTHHGRPARAGSSRIGPRALHSAGPLGRAASPSLLATRSVWMGSLHRL